MTAWPVAVRTRYLRYELRISDRWVEVRTPDGRLVDIVMSIRRARRVVRDHRAGRPY